MQLVESGPPTHCLSYSQRLYLSGLLIYLYSQVLDGPFRFVLGSLGLVSLLYLRDAIILVIIVHSVLASIVRWRANVVFSFILLTLILSSIVALIYVRNTLQILFGLKILLPLIAGVVCAKALLYCHKSVSRHFSILFILATLGVLVNILIQFPWTGFTYELAGVEIEGGFERITSGFSRIHGFSRTNFEAATQILLLWIFLNFHSVSRARKILIWSFAVVAIFLTTTKGVILAFFSLSILMLVFALLPSLRKLKILFLGSALAVMIALPLYINELDIDFSDPVHVSLYASLADRIVNGWPPVIRNVLENGNILTGRGVGGTGAAELYFAPVVLGSPDSLFVFLLSWFGLFGVLMLLMVWWKTGRMQLNSTYDQVSYYWVLSIYIYGISGATLESPFFATFFGFSLYYIFTYQVNTASSRGLDLAPHQAIH